MNRNDEELEYLSFDSEESDFLLNDSKLEDKPLIDLDFLEDNKVDTKEEKDMEDSIYLEEIIKEIKEEPLISSKKKRPLKLRKLKKLKIKKEKIRKERNKKVYIFQVVFCTLSVIMILFFSLFYGTRLIKFYKIYNPKTEDGEKVSLLGNSITSASILATSGDGLYRISGSYIYKGLEVNNYISYANSLWRIIKINSDGSLDIANDSYINVMNFDDEVTSYDKSDIRKYLNSYYLDTLDKSLITNVSVCNDLVNSLDTITCNETNSDDYVRLLGITEFLNSSSDGKSFLADNSNYIWLYNTNSKSVWNTSGNGVGTSNPNSGYLVKSVVRIKNSVTLISGDGTQEKPYKIEKESKKLGVGSYVKLDNDVWVVYEVNKDSIKLSLSKLLSNTYRYSSKTNLFDLSDTSSLAYYLNNTYLNSLSYKDKLLETTYNIGSYESYENISSKAISAKVGLMDVRDVKLNNIDTESSYYIMTPGDTNYTYMVGSSLRQSKITISRNIKPAISIANSKIESGKGTLTDPYVLEG